MSCAKSKHLWSGARLVTAVSSSVQLRPATVSGLIVLSRVHAHSFRDYRRHTYCESICHMNRASIARKALDVAMALLFVLCVDAGPAAGYSARIAWSEVAQASGYRVYVRQDSGAYGSGVDAGAPAPDQNGVIYYTVGSLPLGPTNYFVVASYDASGSESDPSNELSIDYASAASVVDSDSDGLTDAQEDTNLNQQVDGGETNPQNADSDSDGLTDGEEVNTHGTNPLNSDSDGDGYSDGDEVAGGTDPNDSNSPLGAVCGNGVIESGEQCDDGNLTSGDCCGSTCQFEASGSGCNDGNSCTPIDQCNGAGVCVGGGSTCGDGVLDASCGEQCDDGNTTAGDCCGSTCQFEASGSGCNDGNSCTPIDQCNGAGVCVGGGSTCGDGVLDGACGEQCDDGNLTAGDCCSSACIAEDLGSIACGQGVCRRQQSRCVNGSPAVCTPGPPTEPGSETSCDGLDNDCDGSVDEGNPGGGASCGFSDLGQCQLGVLTCQSNSLICVGDIGPDTEGPQGDPTCSDSTDNDCDGLVDAADSSCAGCGNGIIDSGETCDGSQDSACPDLCRSDCTCPTYVELPLVGWKRLRGRGSVSEEEKAQGFSQNSLRTRADRSPATSYVVAYPKKERLHIGYPTLGFEVRDDGGHAVEIRVRGANRRRYTLRYEPGRGLPMTRGKVATFPLNLNWGDGQFHLVFRDLESDLQAAFGAGFVEVTQARLLGSLALTRILFADELELGQTAQSVSIPTTGWNARRRGGLLHQDDFDDEIAELTLRAEPWGRKSRYRVQYPAVRRNHLVAPYRKLSFMIRDEEEFTMELYLRPTKRRALKIIYDPAASQPIIKRRRAILPLNFSPVPGSPYSLVTLDLASDVWQAWPGTGMRGVVSIRLRGQFQIADITLSEVVE